MIKWIITGGLASLTITFACLKSVWAGFIYLGIICITLLCLYWIYIRAVQYKIDYYDNFEKAFIVFKADYVNSSNITTEEFENNQDVYLKEFKKLLRKDKLIDIFKILFIVVVLIVCIVAMIEI